MLGRWISFWGPTYFQGRKCSGDSWMYPYQRTLIGNPYISPIYWVFMGCNPQESLENTINTLGTLLGVHPIVPWNVSFREGDRWDFSKNQIHQTIIPPNQPDSNSEGVETPTESMNSHSSQSIQWIILVLVIGAREYIPQTKARY